MLSGGQHPCTEKGAEISSRGQRRPPSRCRYPWLLHSGRSKIPGDDPSAASEAIRSEQRRRAGPQGRARPRRQPGPSLMQSCPHFRARLRSALQPADCPRQCHGTKCCRQGSRPLCRAGGSQVAGEPGDPCLGGRGNHSRSYCRSRAGTGGCAGKALNRSSRAGKRRLLVKEAKARRQSPRTRWR